MENEVKDLNVLARYAQRFQREYHFVPTHDQLQEFIRTAEPVVAVQFHGSSKLYHYKLHPGPDISEGDYVAVWSPCSYQVELVRVGEAYLTTVERPVAHKYASRIEWSVRSGEPRL